MASDTSSDAASDTPSNARSDMSSNNALKPSEDSKLLSLPLELLTRTTDFLGDDALATLRLTCKTLDISVFDRFTTTFVRSLSCCAFIEVRWRRICNILTRAPCLRERVLAVRLTFTVLEHRDSTQINLAPKQNESLRSAQQSVEKQFQTGAQQDQEGRRPDMSLMIRVLHEVSSINRRLDVYLVGLTRTVGAQWPVHRDILLAIASSTVLPRLDTLHFGLTSFSELQDFLPAHESRLLEAAAKTTQMRFSLRSFGSSVLFEEDIASVDLPADEVASTAFAKKMIGAAEGLTRFELELMNVGTTEEQGLMTSRLLLANPFNVLQTLTLFGVIAEHEVFLEALRKCTRSLTSLHLGCVGVKSPTTRWPDLFCEMAFLRNLDTFSFAMLKQTSDGENWETLHFVGDHSDETTYSVKRDTEGVQAGLQRLSHGGIKFVAGW